MRLTRPGILPILKSPNGVILSEVVSFVIRLVILQVLMPLHSVNVCLLLLLLSRMSLELGSYSWISLTLLLLLPPLLLLHQMCMIESVVVTMLRLVMRRSMEPLHHVKVTINSLLVSTSMVLPPRPLFNPQSH